MAASAADRYEIVTELGRGGMGVVYKARDSMLGRVVALKRVLARDNKLVIKRFLGEAKSIAALNHPNIIQIYDIGEDAEGLYITTEFVEGTDLYRLLRKKGALEGKVAIRLVIPICKAMAYAHARGVIHRDIKPANVLLTADGMPKIADFGLARLDDMKAQEMTGMVMGTQSYASPEQFKDSKHVDHRTDIYSIGAMFFEMLTGIRPQHFRESAVPDPFKQVVLKALEHDRARRYQQLEEMIRDLDALRTGRAVAAAPAAAPAAPAAPAARQVAGVAARPLAHDQAIKGALGEEMVLIPAGPFRFGPEGKRVDLPAYYIDKYPVTNEQYARVFPAHVFPPEEARHPVVKISWEQAMQFARKIGKRLPTEAEWEKAARGTDGRQYPWGNEFAPERCNTFESGMGVTTPVDAYPAGKSPMGVMDMAGNAWEWTATRHESAPAFRVLKGGAYDGKADFALCAQRFAYHQSGLFQASGFRCVKSAE